MTRREPSREPVHEIRLALNSLPMAVIAADEKRTLRPLNAPAERLFDEEALGADLIDGYRAHPIARAIRAIDAGSLVETQQTLTFPSGKRYRVRISTPSQRRATGWLLMLIEMAPGTPDDVDELFNRWGLTPREREIAAYLMHGESTATICLSAGIAVNTLRTHVRSILDKSGTHSRTTLIARVLGRRGKA